MKKRLASPFSMSFLDIMFCGFGAVVLLVIILNGQVLEKRKEKSEDFRAQLNRVTKLEKHARANLETNRKRVEAVQLEEAKLRIQIVRLQETIRKSQNKAREADDRHQTLQKSVAELKSGNQELRQQSRTLKTNKTDPWAKNDRNIGFSGDGRRQYLTGLKLGGARTLILLDSSASMLDETIVNIVRRKFMNAEIRRHAPKWKRAVKTLHWLIANLQRGKLFQVYAFNTRARPVVEGSDGQWMRTDDTRNLEATIAGARRIAPQGGTSLYRAFEIVGRLNPAPDNVILLTDGLPTQGSGLATTAVVSGEERLELYDQAVARLPAGIPVSTLLYPIEGDPSAAEALWRLAIKTKGSFITPSRDWP
jgi:hypothetical protein